MASETHSQLVPFSQLQLCRQRKSLSDALASRDWDSIKRLDQSLIDSVNSAADDPGRDMATLLKELKVVVGLYRDIIQQCDDSVNLLLDQKPL